MSSPKAFGEMSANVTMKHGTRATYTNRRCRCDDCYRAYRAYRAEYEARRQARCSCELTGRETCPTCKPCSIDGCRDIARNRGWCWTHYQRWRKYGDPLECEKPHGPPWDRFWSKVDASGDCWIWTASRNKGYGHFKQGDGHTNEAHRVAWEFLVGPITDGLQLDHLCRIKACVNPDHLEPVTRRENLRRAVSINRNKTSCVHGHAYTPENTYVKKDGRRECWTCKRNRRRATGVAA